MIKKLLCLAAATAALVLLGAGATFADELTVTVTSSDGYDCSVLIDDDYTTTDYFRTDTVLTVSSDTAMDSLYIMWDTVPDKWTLTIDGKDYTCGEDGFLHEYVKLPAQSTSVQITILTDRTYIAEIYAFSGGEPDWVQKWESEYEEADILYFSTHSDDDVLFFGGLIPTYIDKGCRVQAVYYVDHSLQGVNGAEPYRVHEALNCIWCMGLTHYPQFGHFLDAYSETLEEAEATQDIDEVIEYVVDTIRKFKPQVVISQDFNGEYGHGQHRLLAEATAQALELTADSTKYTDSAQEYGVWDVPKTYYHLFDQYTIEIDDRVPLASFGGKTALEVATEAYTRHESQQWMWYYVSDEYEYACNKFGLYRTLVGEDTGNDVMEHLTPYDEQVIEPETETAEDNPESQEGETEAASGGETTENADGIVVGTEETDTTRVVVTILIIIAVLFALFIIFVLVIYALKRKKEKERAERRRRIAQRRRQSQK